MSKILVVYESKYGNTKRAAEAIVQGMQRVEGINPTLSEIRQVDPDTIINYDVIVIGGPNHMGGPTRGVKKFIDKIGKLSLADKKFAVFDTYGGGDFEKATKKMEQRMHEKAPAMKAVAPGLSIKVDGMKGPITEGELPKAEDFGMQIATRLKTAA
jgi:flavodoxin